MDYNFKRVNRLTNKELEEYFEIGKSFYLKIFGKVKPTLKETFFRKRKALFDNPNYFNYRITKGNEFCGYVSLLIYENRLYLYDITFHETFKRTRAIIETIKFILFEENFAKFDKLYFAVDNKNDISYKTWLHLGAKIEKEHETKSAYYIERQAVLDYLKRNRLTN